jgi:hypothetical protein
LAQRRERAFDLAHDFRMEQLAPSAVVCARNLIRLEDLRPSGCNPTAQRLAQFVVVQSRTSCE